MRINDLSPTALRMLYTLPDYLWDDEIVFRIMQGYADEVDRIDGIIDQLEDGLVPGMASTELGMLSIWEATLGLPVNPPNATVAQRQSAIRTQLLGVDAATGTGVLTLIASQGSGFTIERDTPSVLTDTLTIQYAEGTFAAAMIQRTAQRAWPAHRQLLVHFAAGFVSDLSLTDQDEM